MYERENSPFKLLLDTIVTFAHTQCGTAQHEEAGESVYEQVLLYETVNTYLLLRLPEEYHAEIMDATAKLGILNVITRFEELNVSLNAERIANS